MTFYKRGIACASDTHTSIFLPSKKLNRMTNVLSCWKENFLFSLSHFLQPSLRNSMTYNLMHLYLQSWCAGKYMELWILSSSGIPHIQGTGHVIFHEYLFTYKWRAICVTITDWMRYIDLCEWQQHKPNLPTKIMSRELKNKHFFVCYCNGLGIIVKKSPTSIVW